MIDSKLRGKVQHLFDIPARLFITLKVPPNAITVCAFVIGILCGVFIAIDRPWIAVFLLWLSGFLDVIDGSVARLSNKSSNLGAYLDLVLDRMVEAAVILGFAFLLPSNYIAYLLFFVAVIFNFSSVIVAGALFKNTGEKIMHYDVGIAERTETFVVFTLMILFNKNVYWILMIFNIIIFLTGIIRFIKIIRQENQNSNK